MSGNGRNNRQRIQQCPINQYPTIEHQGGNNTRNCDGGANRLIQPAFLKPDFFVGEEVGGDSGERDGKIFNTGVAENIAHHRKDFIATDSAHRGKRHIQQFQYIKLPEAGHPVLVLLQFTRSIHAAHQGTHGTTRDRNDPVTSLFQNLDRANVGVASRTTTAKGERNSLSVSGLFIRPPRRRHIRTCNDRAHTILRWRVRLGCIPCLWFVLF